MNRLLILTLSLTTFTACSQGEKKTESPAGYDFSKPVEYEMPEELEEISGIAFQPGKKDTLYGIQDETGSVYFWKNGQDKEVGSSKFGKKGDYEDVAITNIYSFVLRSDGTLFQFPTKEIGLQEIATVREWKDLLPAGEYESLYADSAQNELYVLCKNCGADKNEETLSGYVLKVDAGGEVALARNFRINTANIPGLKSKSKAKLRPSAMAFNNKTQEWYIVSSVNKLLIIADTSWTVKQAIHLQNKFFPQPEGISFDIDNNLYISNEAGDTPAGTVLLFPLKKSGH